MYTILQLSDFHIRAEMPDPADNTIIKSLVGYLKNMKLGKIILVYNGDVIDSNTIAKMIPQKSHRITRQRLWDQLAQEAFEKAEKYFEYIMKELDIDEKHVVISCGNHDVNNYYENTEKFICPFGSGENEIEYNSKRFEKWIEFCQRMKFRQQTYENTVVDIEGFSFIISNCQWRDKYLKKKRRTLCMNCNSILTLFKENEARFVQPIDENNKGTIYVAHNPFGDICEDEQFGWPENRYTSIINEVNDTCILQLFGDKHTSAVLGAQYIVGAPLDNNGQKDKDQRIVYRLHQFEGDKILHKAIVYENGAWKSWYDQTDIRIIYNVSKASLKDRALVYLFGNTDKDLVVRSIPDFEKYKKSKEWKNINNLFKYTVNISVVQPNGEAPRVPHDVYGVIDTVCSAINNHSSDESEASMILKGNYRNGKSTFVSLLYLDMLSGFTNGTFRYIPVYINLESLNKGGIPKRGRNSIKPLVKNTLDSIPNLIDTFHHKVCLIVDGIPQYLYSEEAEYDDIYTLIKEYGEYVGSYVYCIDTYEQLEYERSAFYRETTKYLTYFGDISTQIVGDDSRYVEFLDAFSDIEHIGDKRIIVRSNFDSLYFKNIDYCLLTVLKNGLIKKDSLKQLALYIKNKLKNKLGNKVRNIDIAAKAAYLMYFESKDFFDIKKIVPFTIDDDLLYAIRVKIYSQYLLAINYVNIIKNVSKGTIDSLPPEDSAALNQLYEDEVARFIVDSFEIDEIQPKTVIEFEKNNYKLLNYSGKSMLTYIIGKVVRDSSVLVEILKREDSELENYYLDEISRNSAPQGRRLYEYYVAKRSISIGLTRKDTEYHDSNAYIIKLLNDKNARRINREFYMEFYGDRTKAELTLQEEVILKGVDFYHTYHMLALRLKKWRERRTESSLSRLELFTLCDLIQIRLDTPKVTHKRIRNQLIVDKSTPSLFYNPDYNNRNKRNGEKILVEVLKNIDFYLELNKSKENTDVFAQFLRFEKEIFENEKKRLMNNDLEYKRDSGDLFRTLTQLGTTRKIGWHLSDPPSSLSDKDIEKAIDGKKIIESVLEHVYEAYIIGLLYLPNEDKLCEGYRKQDVLNMILIHDLGENVVGDYPPSYCNIKDIAEKEQKTCRQFFLSGQHPEYETMIDYLDLWNGWTNKSDNINIRIAREIDRIQMLYKLLDLIINHKAAFSQKRFNNFFSAIGEIKTPKGRSIYNRLIANNSVFVEKIKDMYQYPIVPI